MAAARVAEGGSARDERVSEPSLALRARVSAASLLSVVRVGAGASERPGVGARMVELRSGLRAALVVGLSALALTVCSSVHVVAAEDGPAKAPVELAAPSRFSADQQRKIALRDRLEDGLRPLRAEGKLDQALESASRMVALDRDVFGRDHPLVAQTLTVLGDVCVQRGDFAGARQALAEAVSIERRHHEKALWRVKVLERLLARVDRLEKLSEDQRHRLTAAMRQAHEFQVLYTAGKIAEATALAEQALTALGAVVGKEDPDYAAASFRLSSAYRRINLVDPRAEKLLVQELETTEKVYGKDHPEYAVALWHRGSFYSTMSAPAEAMGAEAARILLTNLTDTDLDFVYHLRFVAFVLGGRDADVENVLLRAIEINQCCGRDRTTTHADILEFLASLYTRRRGAYAQAEIALKQVLAIRKDTLGKSDPKSVSALRLLADVYRNRGSLDLQAATLKEAEDAERRAPPRLPATNLEMRARAQGFLFRNDFAQAEAIYQQLLEKDRKAGEDSPDYVADLAGLAYLYKEKGDRDRAIALYQQVIDADRRRYGAKHPVYVSAVQNLGAVYIAFKEYDKAEPLLKEAASVRRELNGEDSQAYAACLESLAGIAFNQERYDDCDALHREALGHVSRAGWPVRPDFLMGPFWHARGYVQENQPGRAAALLQPLLAYCEQYLNEVFAVQSERERIGTLRQFRARLDLYLFAARQAADGPPTAELYNHVLAWKDAADPRNELDVARRDPALKDLVGRLATARMRLAEIAYRPPPPEAQAEWVKQMQALRDEKETLEGELARRSGAYRRLKERGALDAAKVAAALPPGVALVDFFEYQDEVRGKARENHLLAFVVRRDRSVECVTIPNSDRLVRVPVAAWRAALAAGDAPRMAASAATLRDRVWKPLEPLLGDATTVLVAPDGALAEMALAALPGRKTGSFLLEDLAIGYVTSGRQVVEILGQRAEAGGRGLLVAGGIDYAADAGSASTVVAAARSLPLTDEVRARIAALPGTEIEAQRVAELFRSSFPAEQATQLSGAEATEARVKAESARRYRYLHLATHGFFESPARVAAILSGSAARGRGPATFAARPEDALALTPLLHSGLLLAGAAKAGGAPAGSEDGVLTAEEVAALDLGGMDLAVLSACDTGLGKTEPGQGVLGLQRALHGAGVRSAVASLWKVDDAATALLMEEFYANLWRRRLPKLEALRQAQLAVLRAPERLPPVRAQMQAEVAKLAAARGRELKAVAATGAGEVTGPRTPPALWAAFVLSGDWR